MEPDSFWLQVIYKQYGVLGSVEMAVYLSEKNYRRSSG